MVNGILGDRFSGLVAVVEGMCVCVFSGAKGGARGSVVRGPVHLLAAVVDRSRWSRSCGDREAT